MWERWHKAEPGVFSNGTWSMKGLCICTGVEVEEYEVLWRAQDGWSDNQHWFCHLLVTWLQSNLLISLNLSFFICKMGGIITNFLPHSTWGATSSSPIPDQLPSFVKSTFEKSLRFVPCSPKCQWKLSCFHLSVKMLVLGKSYLQWRGVIHLHSSSRVTLSGTSRFKLNIIQSQ